MHKSHNTMKVRVVAQFCTGFLGLFLACPPTVGWTSPAIALPQSTIATAVASPDRETILRSLQTADVVYLGETHDDPRDHEAQLQILRSLHENNPKIAIAMEMFQRPYQDVMDRYLAGEISETQLVRDSEYMERWGFPWEYYGPIVRFARENGLPVLAANTPTEVTRRVAKSGLEGLEAEDKKYIPPLAEIDTDNEGYRQMLLEVFRQHQHGTGDGFDRFVEAQVLWDETMAEAIAEFLAANPDYQVVVIVGQGHVVYGYGIPSRVERRRGDRDFVQRSVLFQSPDEAPISTEDAMADFLWKH